MSLHFVRRRELRMNGDFLIEINRTNLPMITNGVLNDMRNGKIKSKIRCRVYG